ncbi:hypothetical protein ENBRE01_1469 [Enteropsectra breve]|nr:hypothetical protein ENBRE01_1469 [Enteropsectra breve]
MRILYIVFYKYDIFNKMFSRQRMKVESTIGHFKSKFAKFSTRIRNGEKIFYKKFFIAVE